MGSIPSDDDDRKYPKKSKHRRRAASAPGMERLTSAEGTKLMNTAEFEGNYPRNRNQMTGTSCGICSTAIIFSSLRNISISEDDVLRYAHLKLKTLSLSDDLGGDKSLLELENVLTKWKRYGCSLDELNVLLCYGLGLETKSFHAGKSTLADFEDSLTRFSRRWKAGNGRDGKKEKEEMAHILVNIRIDKTGHWGVVAAFNAKEGKVLVLETKNASMHYWCRTERLFQFMNTKNKFGQTRGWIEVFQSS